ncbi:hypothetical protein HO133_010952 [Letharia lupina]|uniref:F-box domain-containing protein n=1 Tax=Letharia lupina TaxID=560253 RepID=A0A8H6FDI7_9LECA|nr:uncharacterized protein HO133_010952 [Letharia lupina]KAF6224375.1 hypothetical protein HO133_010952 [Letharia lupina]
MQLPQNTVTKNVHHPLLSTTAKPPLLTLPLELQLLILPHLPYPDALALKHTHTHFYNLVDTNVRLKVAWLLERKTRNLEWPQEKCVMRTDAAFCSTGGGQGWEGCWEGKGGCEVVEEEGGKV